MPYLGTTPDETTINITDGNAAGQLIDECVIGSGAEEDLKIVQDGNAQDYYYGLDDSTDKFTIGKGSTVGSNVFLTIDADGHIQRPLGSAFLAYAGGSSENNIADATETDIDAGTEAFDINADYNASTDTFTAPVSGHYIFISRIRLQNQNDHKRGWLRFKDSGSADDAYLAHRSSKIYGSSIDEFPQQAIVAYDLSAGDTIHFECETRAYGATETATVDLIYGATRSNHYTMIAGYLIG